jgi:hypothetical protein
MDESLIRGLVVGAFLGLVGFVANLVWKLIRSPSEGARRLKVVIVGATGLFVGGIVLAEMGFFGALGVAIAVAAVVWVFKGFKKPARVSPARPTVESMREEREQEPTEFPDSKEVAPVRKTVITCPNCSGRLRVVAGKYIDVKCPHCQTIFRTHT